MNSALQPQGVFFMFSIFSVAAVAFVYFFIAESRGLSDREKKEVVQEAKLLEALSHPNIVQFIEVFKTKKGKLCIIMDYADGKVAHLLTCLV